MGRILLALISLSICIPLFSQEAEYFPSSLDELSEKRQYLGGSTDAYLVESNGHYWVEKRGDSPAHILNEYYTNKAYTALEVPVPQVRLYDTENGLVMLSQFISGVTLQAYLRDASKKKKRLVFDKIQKHFAADALLANWDVIGLTFDNIIVDKNENPWRVDNGSGLLYRAQGAPKGKLWSGTVTEIEAMLNPEVNYTASVVFSGLTRKEIKQQVKELLLREQELLNAVPEHYWEILQARLNYLKNTYFPSKEP